MIDIDFYLKIAELKRNPQAITPKILEAHRSRVPVVFNIESTNSCDQTCPFCPRTMLMTRPVKTMAPDVFRRIASQLTPHPDTLWKRWVEFAEQEYGIPQDEQSENAFFLYILPRVVVLHGYGDPLLDPHIPVRVGMLTERGIPSYFSCNPSNINMDRIDRAFNNGLSYIKFSIDSLSSSVRGKDDFARDYPKIVDVLDLQARRNYKTQIIITMIDLKRRGQKKEFRALQEAFKDTGVYIYLKSADQSWLTGKEPPKSIHWREFCQFPWSSMSVNSSGMVVPCSEDYDSKMIMGDTKINSLAEIWNGPEYSRFRSAHFNMTPGLYCWDTCEMGKVGQAI